MGVEVLIVVAGFTGLLLGYMVGRFDNLHDAMSRRKTDGPKPPKRDARGRFTKEK